MVFAEISLHSNQIILVEGDDDDDDDDYLFPGTEAQVGGWAELLGGAELWARGTVSLVLLVGLARYKEDLKHHHHHQQPHTASYNTKNQTSAVQPWEVTRLGTPVDDKEDPEGCRRRLLKE